MSNKAYSNILFLNYLNFTFYFFGILGILFFMDISFIGNILSILFYYNKYFLYTMIIVNIIYMFKSVINEYDEGVSSEMLIFLMIEGVLILTPILLFNFISI